MVATIFDQTLSLIMPNYNYGHFLEEALESVDNQIVPPTEFIIIDLGFNLLVQK